jgi:hypothetical protein
MELIRQGKDPMLALKDTGAAKPRTTSGTRKAKRGRRGSGNDGALALPPSILPGGGSGAAGGSGGAPSAGGAPSQGAAPEPAPAPAPSSPGSGSGSGGSTQTTLLDYLLRGGS